MALRDEAPEQAHEWQIPKAAIRKVDEREQVCARRCRNRVWVPVIKQCARRDDNERKGRQENRVCAVSGQPGEKKNAEADESGIKEENTRPE